MIKSKLGTNGNKFVRPPGDADGMLRVFRSKAGPAADLVVKIFVTHGEERISGDPKHGVIHDRPLRRITVLDRKRAALKRYFVGWMINGIVFPHVPGFGRGVDLVVELVSPGSNNLLHVVVSELAVVDHIVARVKGIHLIRRSLLNHHRAGDLPTRVFLPDGDVGAVRDSCLNRPLIVDFRRREDSLLTVRIEAVKNASGSPSDCSAPAALQCPARK